MTAPTDVRAAVPAVPSAATRLRWPDVAKGACILLVVLHHVTTKHAAALVPEDLAVVGQAWLGLSHGLKPLRMPLFFALSGFFAARAVHRPWDTGLRRRVVASAWTYTVWLVLLLGFFALESTLPLNRTQDLRELVGDLLWASTGLWFLHALAVYALLALATRRLPAPVVVGAAAVLSALASPLAAALAVEETNRTASLAHLVWFLVGARLPRLVEQVVAARPSRLLPGLLAAYVGLAALRALVGLPTSTEVLVVAAVGVPVGLAASVWLAGVAPLATPLEWLGQRTLPVYVLHVPLLALLHHLPVRLEALGPGPVGALTAASYPLLVTAVVCAGCLAVHRLLLGLGAGLLFAPPARLAGGRAAAPGPAWARGARVPVPHDSR